MSKITLQADPMSVGGLSAYAKRLRAGETSTEATTAIYLSRADRLNAKLGAYEHLAAEQALRSARAIDGMIAAGVDLGPLMGVPVAIKDIIAVDGMPTRAGSNLDVTDIIGPEGPFIQALKRAGCVLLGKAATEEFARGGPTGLNVIRGTPWNPWDAQTHRIPGGSSSGSGVAMAAGLCGFAIGSDTGGSVRLPASYCGVFGFKPTWGTWPTEGVYPTCPSLDTLGLLTRTADDAVIAFSSLTDMAVPSLPSVKGLRLGRPTRHFFEHLDDDVARCMAAAVSALEDAGAIVVETEFPEMAACDDFFRVVIGAEFLAGMGRERFLATRHDMGPVVADRGSSGLDISGDTYVARYREQAALARAVDQRLSHFDAVITPTIPEVPAPLSEFSGLEQATRRAKPIARNTYFANMFKLCAASLPIHGFGADLPVGIQINCRQNEDAKALAICRAIERVFGPPPQPDLSAFLS